MSYDYVIKKYYRVKEEKEYPWPCVGEPNRKIRLFKSDVLTGEKGSYTKHTGLGCFGIILKDDEIELVDKPAHLQVM